MTRWQRRVIILTVYPVYVPLVFVRSTIEGAIIIIGYIVRDIRNDWNA